MRERVFFAVAAVLCLFFALLPVFPALPVGRDALFIGGILLGIAAFVGTVRPV